MRPVLTEDIDVTEIEDATRKVSRTLDRWVELEARRQELERELHEVRKRILVAYQDYRTDLLEVGRQASFQFEVAKASQDELEGAS